MNRRADNPLLVPSDALIDYAAIEPAHIEPAITDLLARARAGVGAAADPALPATWEAVVVPMEQTCEPLWRAWSVAGHLNAVANTPALRDAYNACLPQVTAFSTWVGQHRGLYAQYRRLDAADARARLSPVRQRVLDLALRDFRLSGAELEGPARERYAEIADQQAQASQRYAEHLMDATDRWHLDVTNAGRLDGLPDAVVQAARAAAEEAGQPGWRLTLRMPCYIPVMQHARDPGLREQLYRGYATLASEQGDPDLDNTPLIEQLLQLRAEESLLLGYEHYAALRLSTRMADDAGQVEAFLRELAAKARPSAERDLAELRAYARDSLGMDTLAPWDVAYVSERLREARYDYAEDEVRQYFTLPRVLEGWSRAVTQLFQVRLAVVPASVWHPDVQAMQVIDADGTVRGHLYLDLYARAGKQSGAWVDSERDRRRLDGRLRTPVATLTCNFPEGQEGRPALLSHDDVITLFHESGHALHALLSDVDEPGASPFSAVEWDAIELPSQFMENFCWEWPVLQDMTAHVDTGEPLPRALYDKMLAARNFHSGMQMLRQIEFALFDIRLHREPRGLSIAEVLSALDAVRQEVAVIIPPAWHRFPHNFSHLFAGGYGAGYYSYKWAEVLSADAYAAFEEAAERQSRADTLAPEVGARFREEILAVGGARPAAESFEAFRGRAPSIEALLRHSGLAA